MNSRRAGLIAFGVFALGIAFLHLRPLLVWQFELAPQLKAESEDHRFEVETVTQFPEPDARWTRLRAGNLSLLAPLLQDEVSACRACTQSCVLQFAQGTLALLPERGPSSYEAARDIHTPDSRELSVWRWSWDNWRTIDSLTTRLRNGAPVADAFRFENSASRGVVTVHLTQTQARVLIYAYAEDGSAARVIGLTDVDREDAERLLGTIRVEPVAKAPAEGDCEVAS